jgi:hypothetical protein
LKPTHAVRRTPPHRDLRRDLRRIARDADPRTPQAVVALAAGLWMLEKRDTTPRLCGPARSPAAQRAGAAPRITPTMSTSQNSTARNSPSSAEMLDAGTGGEDFESGYVEHRLREFHRFAERQYGLDTRTDRGQCRRSGRFGRARPRPRTQYLHALQSIVPDLKRATVRRCAGPCCCCYVSPDARS